MPKLRVHNFSVSLDGYAAGPDQSLDHPLGVGGERLHEWVVRTSAFQRIHGSTDADIPRSNTLDETFAAEGDVGIGATIIGRNMFGHQRGPWLDEDWKGWWGDEPPYHHPVFVMSHHPRESIQMAGGTTFHFVDDDIDTVLQRAFDAADGADVRLGGGAATIQQYLRAGLIDDMHLAFAPILLGSGERLFDNLGGPIDYECVELVSSPHATHARFSRRG
jgi:dihydrofolate reductase